MLIFGIFLFAIGINNAAVISNQSETIEAPTQSTEAISKQGTIINYVANLFSKVNDNQMAVDDFIADLKSLSENEDNTLGPIIVKTGDSLNDPVAESSIPSGIANIETNVTDLISSIGENSGSIGIESFLNALLKSDESLSNDITSVDGTLLSVVDVLVSSDHQVNVDDFVAGLESSEGDDETTVGVVLEIVIKLFKLDLSKEAISLEIAKVPVKKSNINNALKGKSGLIGTKDIVIALGMANDQLLNLLVSLQNTGLSIINDLFSNAKNSSVSVSALKTALTALDDDATLGEILNSIANETGFPLAGEIPPPIANIKGVLKPLIKLLDARKGKIPVALIASLIGFIVPALLVITVTQILSGLVSVIGIGVGGLVGLVGALLGGLIGGIIDLFTG